MGSSFQLDVLASKSLKCYSLFVPLGIVTGRLLVTVPRPKTLLKKTKKKKQRLISIIILLLCLCVSGCARVSAGQSLPPPQEPFTLDLGSLTGQHPTLDF